jgi:hypothetical protein
MRPLSCEEVDELLPWYAAGEGEPDPRELVEQHLAHCPRCRQGYAETERLAALLDWHHRAGEGLQRLQERLREESQRGAARRAVLSFVRRLAAVAALLLLALGLTRWVSPPRDELPIITVALAAGEEEAVPGPRAKALPARVGLSETAQRVDLTLEVKNRAERILYLDVGGEGTELRLDLSGPGVRAVPATTQSVPPFLSRHLVRLAPGESYFLPIPYLVEGKRGRLRSLSWTKPGRYTLGVRYSVRVSDTPPSARDGQHFGRIRTFVGPLLTIQVP